MGKDIWNGAGKYVDERCWDVDYYFFNQHPNIYYRAIYI